MPVCSFVCYSTPNVHNTPIVDMEIAARCSRPSDLALFCCNWKWLVLLALLIALQRRVSCLVTSLWAQPSGSNTPC